MIQFFSQMLKFPVAAVAAGFEIMARVVRDMQRTFDRNVDVVTDGMAQSLMNQAADTSTQSPGTGNPDQVAASSENGDKDPTTQTDGGNMGDWDGQDQDLGGDDLKVVRYRIIFTKRDYEDDLDRGEETINYPTNGGSYGGLKVAQFMKKVAAKQVPRPAVWKENCYPPDATGDTDWEFPSDDLRYITFLYEVIRRVEREEKEYDKEQVRILRGIQERL